MCDSITLNQITEKVVRAARESLKEKLDKVILYGSYARGDYNDDSDVDIIVLADIPISDANKEWKKIWNITGDLDLEYNVLVSIQVKDCATFYRFIKDLPFFINIAKEGVELSA